MKKIDLASIRNSLRTFLTPWVEIRNLKGFQYDVHDHTFYLERHWGWFLHSAFRYHCNTWNIKNVPERAFLIHGDHPWLQGWCYFEYTNWFVVQNTFNLMYNTSLYLHNCKDRFGIHQELMEDVSDSLDENQDPQAVPIWFTQP